MHDKPGRKVFDYMEGYVVCAVYSGLERIGKLDRFAEHGLTADDLGSNAFLTEATLRYLSQRGLAREEGGVHRPTDLGRELYADRGYLNWLSGGYGEPLHAFGDLLTGAATFGEQVDRDVRWVAVGTALAGGKDLRPYVMDLLNRIEFSRAADLGCGNGHLLISLCRATGGNGVGIDISADACAEAREEVRRAGMEDRIDIVHADARDPWGVPELEDVQLAMMFFFLHEVLELGYAVLVDYLRQLHARLPRGARALAAEISPPRVAFETPELVSPEYTLTQAFMSQRLLNEDEWRAVWEEAGFEMEKIVPTDLPETHLYLARKA
ncbi:MULTISPECIES: SAM-dependent methyltransferase [Actinomadura]|uniref:SAM-dependent methyltransferase n=2 Tax=Actinomadura yumaensis TaxID=111807 RepID=A0ABW2CFA8_9ACTN|nr:methyltransferase domain-containing protein [Actinomadura sp. J1-007]MWK38234.1 methyltransferase domain-containing protein [Actinomadura sp. J1-007]